MNEVSVARHLLHDALAPILPGRTSAYPANKVSRAVAPYLWLDAPTLDPETIGTATDVWVALFPVKVIVDGSSTAQIDQLDAVVAAIIDACEGEPLLEARHVEPADQFVDTSTVLRGAQVDVAVTILARTFCPPDAITALPIPPVPVPA